jgi:hypothetical protein
MISTFVIKFHRENFTLLISHMCGISFHISINSSTEAWEAQSKYFDDAVKRDVASFPTLSDSTPVCDHLFAGKTFW